MRLDREKGKIIAGIAGIAAAAVLTVVLILATVGAPSPDILARVNGQEITKQEVQEFQRQTYLWYGQNATEEQALEQMIAEKLLYREAEWEGYLLTPEEAEQELVTWLALMGKTIEDLEAQLEEVDLSYDEYLEDFQRQLAIQSFLDEEVSVPEATEEEARAYYEDYREAFLQQYPEAVIPPFEQAQSQIVELLSQEKQQKAIILFIEELKQKADIKIYT